MGNRAETQASVFATHRELYAPRRDGGRRVNLVTSLPTGRRIADCLIRCVTFIDIVKCDRSAVLINQNQDTGGVMKSYSAYTWDRVMPDFNHVRDWADFWAGGKDAYRSSGARKTGKREI